MEVLEGEVREVLDAEEAETEDMAAIDEVFQEGKGVIVLEAEEGAVLEEGINC